MIEEDLSCLPADLQRLIHSCLNRVGWPWNPSRRHRVCFRAGREFILKTNCCSIQTNILQWSTKIQNWIFLLSTTVLVTHIRYSSDSLGRIFVFGKLELVILRSAAVDNAYLLLSHSFDAEIYFPCSLFHFAMSSLRTSTSSLISIHTTWRMVHWLIPFWSMTTGSYMFQGYLLLFFIAWSGCP